MKPAAMLVALFAPLATTGCDQLQQQTVALVLTRGGEPLPETALRLHSLRNCGGTFQEVRTDKDGRASFNRAVEIGGAGVITDELSVCILSSETWWPIFGSLHGPAPRLIELRCDLATTKGACTAKFDGRSLTEFNSGE